MSLSVEHSNSPYIFILGNEKGGAGKTTCSMHLIAYLLSKGYRVSSIDVDCRQRSLTRYIDNRKKYNIENSGNMVPVPNHFVIDDLQGETVVEQESKLKDKFEKVLDEVKKNSDFIIIDTPGSYSYLSRLAHSYADTIITPINDSFVDIDLLAQIDPKSLKMVAPSIYSQMVWTQKMERLNRDGGSAEWVVIRNRLSNLDAQNKRNVSEVLDQLAKRINLEQAPGFGERVIFRDMFLHGLTLLDLPHANYDRPFSASHIAARQELYNFVEAVMPK